MTNSSTTSTYDGADTEQMPLGQFARKAYLDYSMYVIMDRALPFLGDGLKPVQRRIIYAMSELGLKASAKHKKSARTVGDVLGKYHPHGDTACYEAMVLMAQPFTYRYPLVDGQGNWGAVDDPKSFAAMRYTESRLSTYADSLLSELGMGTVAWGPNFDGTLKEPLYLPARLPNLLLNGTTGIAVGMATDIAPHNLVEVVDACIHLLDHPKAELEDICGFIQGPDYPTGAEIITPREEIVEMYRKGQGSIRMRATYEYENGDIVVTALPFQASPAKILEQVVDQMRSKKLPMVSDLRDESDHDEPVRLVIIPRSNRVDKEALMAHLFATTDMEKTFRVNQNVIGLDRKPSVMGLLPLLTQWLTFRTETVRKRLSHRLEKVLKRLHILEGLLVAFLNIDEVIKIIRTADNPKAALMKRFSLSEEQAEAILQLRLRFLAKLEEVKITGERDTLEKERQYLEKLLGSKQRLKTLIKKELKAAAKTFGDVRRTPIVARKQAQAISQVDLAPAEALTVVLSKNGWVRAAKGVDIDPQVLNYRAGDQFLDAAHTKSNQMAVFLDTTGRTYSILAFNLPSARGQGEPLTRHFTPPPDARFQSALGGDPDQHLLMASDAGYGFVTRLSHLYSKNQKGKAFLTLPKGFLPLEPLFFNQVAGTFLVVITTTGRLLVFPLEQLPELPRGKGNKLINIPAKFLKDRQEVVRYLAVLNEDDSLVLHSGRRTFTLTFPNLTGFKGERARRGKLLPRGFRNVSRLETVAPVKPSTEPDDLLKP